MVKGYGTMMEKPQAKKNQKPTLPAEILEKLRLKRQQLQEAREKKPEIYIDLKAPTVQPKPEPKIIKPQELKTTPGKRPHYEHRYKYNKQEEPMDFQQFNNSMKKQEYLALEKQAYLWLSYHSGARKSEIYELKVEQLTLTKDSLIVDYGQRKKHSAVTPPLEFPLKYPGIETVAQQYLKARDLKPSRKTIYYQEETDQPILKNGQPVLKKDGQPRMKKQRTHRTEKAQWLFPNIGAQTAWRLVKSVLGEQYYPHFLRLNDLTQTAINDPTATVVTLKSKSGIKSLRALEAYIGTSKKETAKAISSREKEWS